MRGEWWHWIRCSFMAWNRWNLYWANPVVIADSCVSCRCDIACTRGKLRTRQSSWIPSWPSGGQSSRLGFVFWCCIFSFGSMDETERRIFVECLWYTFWAWRYCGAAMGTCVLFRSEWMTTMFVIFQMSCRWQTNPRALARMRIFWQTYSKYHYRISPTVLQYKLTQSSISPNAVDRRRSLSFADVCC